MTAESTHLETAMNRITTIILASALAAGAFYCMLDMLVVATVAGRQRSPTLQPG
jgi:hypothetical protein